jgi:hypothetical protein
MASPLSAQTDMRDSGTDSESDSQQLPDPVTPSHNANSQVLDNDSLSASAYPARRLQFVQRLVAAFITVPYGDGRLCSPNTVSIAQNDGTEMLQQVGSCCRTATRIGCCFGKNAKLKTDTAATLSDSTATPSQLDALQWLPSCDRESVRKCLAIYQHELKETAYKPVIAFETMAQREALAMMLFILLAFAGAVGLELAGELSCYIDFCPFPSYWVLYSTVVPVAVWFAGHRRYYIVTSKSLVRVRPTISYHLKSLLCCINDPYNVVAPTQDQGSEEVEAEEEAESETVGSAMIAKVNTSSSSKTRLYPDVTSNWTCAEVANWIDGEFDHVKIIDDYGDGSGCVVLRRSRDLERFNLVFDHIASDVHSVIDRWRMVLNANV